MEPLEKEKVEPEKKKVDKYIIEKHLCELRDTYIRVGLTSDGGKKRAIKYYKRENEKTKASKDQEEKIKSFMEYEVRVLTHLKKELKEPNRVIVDMSGYSFADNYYILFEYLPNGTLLDFINYLHKHNKMTEELAKAIFKNLLDLVYEIHKYNVSHLDLKPENVMFDGKGEMKLIDFGHSYISNNGIRILHPGIGTAGFNAPETRISKLFKKYIPRSADVFSLGMILFALYSGQYLAGIYNETQDIYSLIIKEEYEKFWDHWCYEVKSKFSSSSEELKQLIISMILYHPETRSSLNEVMNSPWIKSTTQARYEELNIYIRNLVIESKQ